MQIDYTKYGYIYKITNSVKDKIYIGLHRITKDEEWMTYLGSGTAISRAVRKHGREKFSKDLIVYADSEKELCRLETFHINQAVQNGEKLYNIFKSKSEKMSKRTILNLNEHPILDWYFDDKLSTADIADKLKISQPTVYAYLQTFKDSDERFKQVVHGRGLSSEKRKGKTLSDDYKKKISKSLKSKEKVQCEYCEEFFGANAIFIHRKTCKETPWPHCLHCDKRLSKRTAKYCFDHRFASMR